jgi:hypothetical protein
MSHAPNSSEELCLTFPREISISTSGHLGSHLHQNTCHKKIGLFLPLDIEILEDKGHFFLNSASLD